MDLVAQLPTKTFAFPFELSAENQMIQYKFIVDGQWCLDEMDVGKKRVADSEGNWNHAIEIGERAPVPVDAGDLASIDDGDNVAKIKPKLKKSCTIL